MTRGRAGAPWSRYGKAYTLRMVSTFALTQVSRKKHRPIDRGPWTEFGFAHENRMVPERVDWAANRSEDTAISAEIPPPCHEHFASRIMGPMCWVKPFSGARKLNSADEDEVSLLSSRVPRSISKYAYRNGYPSFKIGPDAKPNQFEKEQGLMQGYDSMLTSQVLQRKKLGTGHPTCSLRRNATEHRSH